MPDIKFNPGPIVLMGSGETSPSSGAVFEKVAGLFEPPVRINVLETPAGFELNSPWVANRVASHLQTRLQNYKPDITVIPARRKGTQFGPDTSEILETMYSADILFLGPGSPTYTARQLTDSMAFSILQVKQRTGSALVLASAATIAFGCQTMPVYEIFKAGMDLHWQPGLDFFQVYGLSLIIIPHWNNAEGGANLDTSRCFMGASRFEELRAILPCDGTIVGIDEHTSLWIDLARNTAEVFGKDAVHIIKGQDEQIFNSGEVFPLEILGAYSPVKDLDSGIHPEVREKLQEETAAAQDKRTKKIPDHVKDLVAQRETARANKDYQESDRLRAEAEAQGWRILDTPDGPQIEKI